MRAKSSIPSLLGAVTLAAALGAGPIEPTPGGLIDVVMYHRPQLPAARARQPIFPERLAGLWLQALDRPEQSLRRKAATAFGKAHAEGMTVPDAATKRLAGLAQNDPSSLVRQAAAASLVQMDHRPAAAPLLAADRQHGEGLAATVDPALARWGHRPAIDLWLSRLQGGDADRSLQISAIRALGTIQAEAAIAPLRRIAGGAENETIDGSHANSAHGDDSPPGPALRLAAAKALGLIPGGGDAALARRLAEGDQIDQLAAVPMLAGSGDERALAVLRTLAEPNRAAPVVAAAVNGLRAVDPMLVAQSPTPWLNHEDPAVRFAATQTLQARDDPQAVTWLAGRLSDRSPKVRRTARRYLKAKHEKPAQTEAVAQATADTLAGSNWRAIEQAALLAMRTGQTRLAEALVERLDHERPEARLAAAAALRELDVSNTYPALLDRARAISARFTAEQEVSTPTSEDLSRELVQLFTALGLARDTEADSLLREYVPKGSPFPVEARAAAVWALGMLYGGEPNEALVSRFQGRLSDVMGMQPEAPVVRRFAAISLGRMEARTALDTLRRFQGQSSSSRTIRQATAWAIGRITGQAPATQPAGRGVSRGWFLEPIDPE